MQAQAVVVPVKGSKLVQEQVQHLRQRSMQDASAAVEAEARKNKNVPGDAASVAALQERSHREHTHTHGHIHTHGHKRVHNTNGARTACTYAHRGWG